METLIKNGTIVDGTGTKPYIGDLLIKDGKIAGISTHISLPKEHFCSEIDAGGKYVTPGFIDIHRHADTAVFRKGFGDLELHQGLTSIVNGNCGLSCAPLSVTHGHETEEYLMPVTGPLGLCRYAKISDYMQALKKAHPPIFCGMLAGTGTIRASVTGYGKVSPTDDEIKSMHALLEDALSAGVLGISMGVEYAPECFCQKEELLRLLTPAKGCGLPLIMHVRNEGDSLHDSLREAVYLAKELSLPLHISHIKCIGKRNFGHGSDESLSILDHARQDGMDVTCDVYPYTAGSTQLMQLIPNIFQKNGIEETLESLSDPNTRKTLAEVLAHPSDDFDNFVEMEGWENILVSAVYGKKNTECIGKSMTEIAAMRHTSPLDAALDLLIDEHGEVAMIDRYACEEDVRKFMSYPYSCIISDSLYADTDTPHPRLYGSFTRVLEKYVAGEHLFPIETAVRKMSGLPAEFLKIKGKGFLKEGCDADILVFDLKNIRENATFEKPKQLGSGFDHILIGGKTVG